MSWTVRDVMTKEVVTVEPGTSFKACIDLLRIHRVSALPVVYPTGEVAGIVSEADLLRKEVAAPVAVGSPRETPIDPRSDARTAGELMTADVATIDAAAPLPVAARRMADRRIKRLVVTDGDGRLIGILSRADVLKVFQRSDESLAADVGALVHNPLLVGSSHLEFDVREGVVHISGAVEAGNLPGLLARILSGIPGVVGVENHALVVDTVSVNAED